MSGWAIYRADGSIDRIYSGPESEAMIQPQGSEQVVLLPGDLDDQSAYVVDGVVTEKQPFTFLVSATEVVANGADTVTISGIPEGTEVTIAKAGIQETINDGLLEWDTDLPGTYIFQFTAIPYLDQEVTLEAVVAT